MLWSCLRNKYKLENQIKSPKYDIACVHHERRPAPLPTRYGYITYGKRVSTRSQATLGTLVGALLATCGGGCRVATPVAVSYADPNVATCTVPIVDCVPEAGLPKLLANEGVWVPLSAPGVPEAVGRSASAASVLRADVGRVGRGRAAGRRASHGAYDRRYPGW